MDLFTRYKSVIDKIVYNEEWDKTAKIKKSERDESKIEEGGLEKIKIDISKLDQSKVKKSDQFKDCE